MNLKIFLFWLFFVVIWNFGVPNATPLWDVIMAIIFSMISILADFIMNEK